MERLDLRGLRCPLPALKAARRLAAMEEDGTLEILADDPLAGIDIAHLCASEGHRLVEHEHSAESGFRFLVRRGPAG